MFKITSEEYLLLTNTYGEGPFTTKQVKDLFPDKPNCGITILKENNFSVSSIIKNGIQSNGSTNANND